MYILGINISHDSSSCLLKNGEIIFYKEDERVSKIKHNITKDFKNLHPYIYHHGKCLKKCTNFIDYIIFVSYGSYFNDEEKINSILIQLKNLGLEWGKVFFDIKEHHLYHASNAAFSSGFEECVCLIQDSAGSCFEFDDPPFREIESIYFFNYHNGFEKKFKHYSRLGNGFYKDFEIKTENNFTTLFSDSLGCGKMFDLFSHALGYQSGFDAGKIMALSSYGLNVNDYSNWYFSLFGSRITNNNLILSLIKSIPDLQLQDQQNILKTLQEETKEHTIYLIEKSLDLCNTNKVVLSGGYFLNCVNNYHYLKKFPDVQFYVDPIAHDGGTALGAAKYLWWDLTKDQTIRKLDSLYLG